MNRIAIVLCLAAGVAVAGCGKKAEEKLTEKMIEKSLSRDGVTADVDLSGDTMSFTTTDADGKKSNVKMSGDEMTIQGPDGQTTFRAAGAGKMPEDFPADVYVYPGASVVSSLSYPGGYNLVLESSAASKDVVAKYSAEMKGKGWAESSSMNTPEMSMTAFAKGNRTANLIVQAEGGTTTLNLTVVTEQE